jgi:hypothetical protein
LRRVKQKGKERSNQDRDAENKRICKGNPQPSYGESIRYAAHSSEQSKCITENPVMER